MVFKCKNCNGNVVYSPEKHTMFCPYCDSQDSEEQKESTMSEINICPDCNGVIQLTEHTAATKCPYCGDYVVLNSRVEGEFTPKWIIPFKMGKEGCKKLLQKRFKKVVFAPTDFLSETKLKTIEGTYVPYWMYDYDTNCEFQGRGSKVRTWTEGNIEYKETKYYDVYRNFDLKFRNVPADASESMPDSVMDLVEPFQYKELENFQPKFLSGFLAEKYNMTSDVVEQRARTKMEHDAESILKESYQGYDHMQIIDRDVRASKGAVDYGLLPVWRYEYKYKDKDYPFYVNGQTGKIVGEVPISKGKVCGYSFTLWGSLTLLLLLVNIIIGTL